MASASKGLEAKLRDLGNRLLLHPPSFVHKLLPLLQKAESYLSKVEQQPSTSTKTALSPLMEALVADQILKHGNDSVKVTIISCISEVIRITAPDAPYDDNLMTEIFNLTVPSLGSLSDTTSSCYSKAVSILKSIATYRWCLVMMDLECDQTILDLFQLFLNVIRPDHPEEVLSSMETIMTLVIDESENISVELLRPILAVLRKDNKNVSAICRRLGEKVIANCAKKLRPYLSYFLTCLGTSLSDYPSIVSTICQNESDTPEKNLHESGSREQLVTSSSMKNNDTVTDDNPSNRLDQHSTKNIVEEIADRSGKKPQKRSWKPHFLVNPEEGYDYGWIGRKRRTNQKKIIGEASSVQTNSPKQLYHEK